MPGSRSQAFQNSHRIEKITWIVPEMKLVDPQDLQISAIVSAATEIHCQLGCGFLKAVYKDAAIIEFSLRNIPFQYEVLIPVKYKDYLLPTHYRVDFICFSDVFVEFEAISNLSAIEEAQTLNHIKATGLRDGLLINFGSPSLQHKSFVWDCETIHNSKKISVQSV